MSEKKFKRFVANTAGNENFSEIIQLMSFGFGYRWARSLDQKVAHKSYQYLIFDPNEKSIHYSSHEVKSSEFGEVDSTTLFNVYYVLDAFKNPTVVEQKIHGCMIDKDGSVVVGDADINFNRNLTSDQFDEVVAFRDKKLGRTKKKKLPLVSFNYGFTYEYKNRKILVVETSDTLIKGLDTEDGNQFKSFAKAKIQGGIVTFLGLVG